MAGTVEWDDEPGVKSPVPLRDHARTPGRRATTSLTGRADLARLDPRAADTRCAADVRGIIVIRPLGGRIIRYELAFTGDDGQRYEMVGQKDISWRHPLTTFTTLPAEIVDEDHRRVGYLPDAGSTSATTGGSFLRSFRLA